MRTVQQNAIATVLAVCLAATTPAFAQLTDAETAVKQSLEQKAQQQGLNAQEIALYTALIQKDREQPDPLTQSAEEAAGRTLGTAAGFIIVGIVAAVLCATGIVPACPLVAAVGG